MCRQISKSYYLSSVLSLLFPLLTICGGSNILFFHSFSTSSHRISIWPLAEALADRGHHVTYIFPMEKRMDFHPKIEEIVPSKMLPILAEFLGDFDINIRLNNTVIQWTMQLFGKTKELCEAFYDSPEVKKWLAKPTLHYDLIMIDGSMGECAFGLVHKFKAKHILFYPLSPPPFMWDGYGLVPESASIPEGFFHRKSQDMPVSFISRLLTTLSRFLWRFGLLDMMRRSEPIIKTALDFQPGDEMPSMLEIERNTSLIFVNSHFIEDYAYALPPMVQSYSGLWCSKKKLQELKPLPKEIAHFVEDPSSEGFVYVSFGSAVMSSAMPASLRDQFISAFRAFPKLKFLWRWPADNVPENIPKNVMLRSWFPQRDLLAHEKIKAFVTQAGRPSSQEALCQGVPMITIPIFGDQDFNADRLELIGASITLLIENFSEDELKQAITTIIGTPSYKTKMKELSSMFRDRPLDPLENVVYWTEFVLGRDTRHLKPLGMNLTWYQRRLFDVYAFIIVTIMSILAVVVYMVKMCASKFCQKKKTRKEKVN